jgi:hypothetical protein
MVLRGRPGSRVLAAALVMLLACEATPARAAQDAQAAAPASDAVLYRVFLRDGSMLVSYGEYAQVADRVIMSIPIGGTDDNPELHVLSIAHKDVDWEQTTAYAQAASARRFAETRGEAEFAAVSREVANTLNRIAFVNDPVERLKLAESARRRLVEWPEQHYGYRADDILQMATWLEQVVSEFRVAAGQSSFDLALVARTVPAVPSVQLLPAPTFRERVELGLRAASRTTDAAERVSLLRSVLKTLESAPTDASWLGPVRARASAELKAELKTTRAYAELTGRALARAEPLVRRADVRGLQDVVRSVLEQDARLEHARPADVATLLATLDAKLGAARRLRLARDAWAARAGVLRAYWSNVRQGLDRLLGLREWLVDVRELAGPAPRSVRRLGELSRRAEVELTRVRPPAEVAGAHGSLISAAGLAGRAAAARADAVRSGNMDAAWQASSAAAGALMVLEQAVAELRRLTNEPEPDAVK